MSGFSSPDNIALTEKHESDVKVKETPDSELCEVYQLDRCISWINQHDFKRTCLQFPDKLLNDGISVALYLEKVFGRCFYVLADTSFGSCCVDHISAEHVNGDSIIHFGHACLSPFSKLPVLYIFEKMELDVQKLKNVVENIIPTDCNITIFYDDIYHHLYSDLCETFKNGNVDVSKILLPEEEADQEDKLFGRVFNRVSLDNNSFAVFLGEHCVTLQNLALALPDVRWYYYPKNDELLEYELGRSKFLMKKYHQIEVVKSANIIGILIGTLGIENYLSAIERVKHLAKYQGKKCYILAVGRPNVNKLANFPEVDVFVSIACPENTSKDFKDYYKPVVSLYEVEMALGNHPFDTEYVNDFREVLKRYSVNPTNEVEPLEESHVSLTTGKIITPARFGVAKSSELQEKMSGVLAETKGADFLINRSWRGLQQNVGDKEVAKVEVGRSGIPHSYENECSTLKNDS